MDTFSAAWRWDSSGGGTYTDGTINASTNDTTESFTFISAATDRFYIGFSREFKGFIARLNTNGSYTSLVYKYYDGSTWKRIVPIVNYKFDGSKYLLFDVPTDWQPLVFTTTTPQTATSVPDSVSRYWLEISASAVTTAAVPYNFVCLPEITYTTPTKVHQLLQIKQDFTTTSQPSRRAIIELIKRAESTIDYRTRKSWKWNVENTAYDTQIQLADFNRWGVPLRHWPVIDLYSVSIWDGGSFSTMVVGRNQDYFIDNATATLYITRMFLLPLTYGISGRFMNFAGGEFKRAVQIDYTYGRNWKFDPEFGVAQDVATKLAAVDVITSSDYSNLTSSGVQNVDLLSKVDIWQQQIEQKLDSLTAIAIW